MISSVCVQGQLFQLMQRLESTTPHFIRCIKPNNLQSPESFEQGLVLHQLRCCGVLEVVRISRSGFPTRMFHQKFARRYNNRKLMIYILSNTITFHIPSALVFLHVSILVLIGLGVLNQIWFSPP